MDKLRESAWISCAKRMDKEIVMNYRNSVGTRLTLAFAGVIIVFGAAVALSIGRLAAFNDSVTVITGPDLAKVELASGWMDALSESMRHTRNMLIMDDKEQIQGEIGKVRALFDKREKFAEEMTAVVRSPESKALLQAALDARDTLKPLDENYLREVQAGDIKAAKDTLLQRSRPAQLALIASLQKLSDHQQSKIRVKAEALAVSYRSTRTMLITLSLAAVAVACLLAWLLTRGIKRPLNHAVAVLGEIEKGNYANTVMVSSKDEI